MTQNSSEGIKKLSDAFYNTEKDEMRHRIHEINADSELPELRFLRPLRNKLNRYIVVSKIYFAC